MNSRVLEVKWFLDQELYFPYAQWDFISGALQRALWTLKKANEYRLVVMEMTCLWRIPAIRRAEAESNDMTVFCVNRKEYRAVRGLGLPNWCTCQCVREKRSEVSSPPRRPEEVSELFWAQRPYGCETSPRTCGSEESSSMKKMNE